MVTYDDFFQNNKISSRLQSFQKILNQTTFLMEIPLRLGKTQSNKETFFKKLNTKINEKKNGKPKYIQVAFICYVWLNEKDYHAICGVVHTYEETRYFDLYDSNGNNSYKINRSNFSIRNQINQINQNHNELYQILIIEMKKIIPGYSFHVFDNNNFKPKVCPIQEAGVCALWCFVYILLRSYHYSVQTVPMFIHDISKGMRTNSASGEDMLLMLTQVINYNLCGGNQFIQDVLIPFSQKSCD